MSDEKIFLSWKNQVNRLEGRHLKFRNEEEKKNARYALQNNSYYAIINGYKDFFCTVDESGKEDYHNELFVNLRDTFDFDKELSAILFKYLLRIEDSFKAIFSYHVGEKYGHMEKDYLNENNFRKGNYLSSREEFERDVLLDKLTRTIAYKNEPQLQHYREHYNYTPPWVLASCVSLDTLMYWYKLSKRSIKEKTVSTMLYDYSQYPFSSLTDTEENLEYFTNLMTITKEYRNRAAHGNRVINHKSKHNIKIHLLELYTPNRDEVMVEYNNGSLKGDAFSLFATINIMLSKRDTVRKNYLLELENLFFNLKKGNPYLYYKIINSINLSENFADILRGMILPKDRKTN